MVRVVESGRSSAPFAFVGRRRELGELELALSDAVGGQGRSILVSGEPGIGKSQLVGELSRLAGRHGAAALWGLCWEGGGAPAFWPWIQILRDLSRGEHATVPRSGPHLRRLVPELQEGSVGLPSETFDSEHARFRLFDEAATFLREAATARPLLLILEDLHASDLPSLFLLRFLARSLRDPPILIVATARDLDARRRSGVAEALDDVAREGHRVALGGLAEDEIGELVERVCGVLPPRELVASIHRTTDGNPFFADETVRLLLSEHHGRIPDRVAAALPIPTRVRETIRRRLEPLDADGRRILSTAAVLGTELDVGLLARLCDVGAGELRDWMAEVESLGLVRFSADTGSFAHSLVRETVYEDLAADERVEFHARVASALEAAHAGDAEPPLAEIAFHFHAGLPRTDVEKAFAFASAAGRRAMALCAYENAVDQYRRALAALAGPAGEGRRRCETLLRIGEASRKAGDVAGARQVFAEAVEVARSLDDPQLFAEAALGLGGPWVAMGIVDDALVEHLEEAAGLLGDDSGALRARVLSRLAMELYFAEGSLARRHALAEEARKIADDLGDARVRAEVLAAHHFALWGPGNADERLATATAIAEIAREIRSEELALAAHHWRIVDLVELGDIAATDLEIDAMEKLATRLRIPVFLWQVTLHRTMRSLLDGRFAEAEELATRAFEHGRKAQPESAEGSFLVHRVVQRREQGRLEEIAEEVNRWVRRYRGGMGLGTVSAFVQAELGNHSGARLELGRSLEDGPEGIAPGYFWLGSMALLCEVVAALGETGHAAVLHDRLAPYADRNLVLGRSSASLGSAAHYLGLLAVALGRIDDARRYFQEALERNRRMGAYPFVARTGFEYARVLHAAGESDRATRLAHEARDTARALGMEALLTRIERWLQERRREGDASRVPGEISFVREGQFWTVRFHGRVLRLKDTRGLRLIAWLLGHPGRELHAIELAGVLSPEEGERGIEPGGREMIEEGLAVTRLDGSEEILDARARGEYRQRIADLEEELEEAERFRDRGRAERIRGELDTLTETLSAATGFGGRKTRSGSPAERARVTLTKAIRAAIRRIAAEDADLGRHLERTIRTGRFFSYDPERRSPPLQGV